MVEFEHVAMRYGHGPEVLRDISFRLASGSFHFLTGPSGAGKSTLLQLMYLARYPNRGVIRLFGEDLATANRKAVPLLRRQIGIVFQDYRLLDHMTVMDNVALPLRITGAQSEEEVRANVTDLINWVGLGDRIDAKPPTLSGGEKQRVAIARAVVAQPNLLLADEPTGNVDQEMGNRLMHLLAQLNKFGTAVVIATHDLDMVKRLGYPELALQDGHLDLPR